MIKILNGVVRKLTSTRLTVFCCVGKKLRVISCHYIDVIMTTVASQITSLTIVYSIVYSVADQRKYQSSASLAFVRGIHRDRWIPRTKGQLRGKCFHLMTSSCFIAFYSHDGLLYFILTTRIASMERMCHRYFFHLYSESYCRFVNVHAIRNFISWYVCC